MNLTMRAPASFPVGQHSLPLWPILLLCFVSLSSGAETVAGVPRVLLLSALLGAVMLFIYRGIKRPAVLFVACLLASFVPGVFSALVLGKIEILSSISLIYSLILFIAVFSYTLSLFQNHLPKLLRVISLTMVACLTLFVFEILFYAEFCGMRASLYPEAVLHILCQTDRSADLYGFPRPALLFSEPSNFARFAGILVTAHLLVSKRVSASIIWFLLFLFVTRSISYLICLPVFSIVLIYKLSRSPISNTLSKRKIWQSSAMVAFGLAAIIMVAVSLQATRLSELSSGGTDGSLQERVVLPLVYIAEKWQNPLLGSGPTPGDEMTEYIGRLFVYEGQRHWLIGQNYRAAVAGTLTFVVSLGAFGMLILLLSVVAALGRRGALLLVMFLLVNLLNSGTNSPIMYVPSAIFLAMVWCITSPIYQRHVTSVAVASGAIRALPPPSYTVR